MIDKELVAQMKEWRHHMHAHPETALEEVETAKYVANILTEMGLEVHTGIGVTGVVAVLKAGNGGKTIGLRADMDAINLNELGTPPYRSQVPGKMHACGHDGHTATLLGAAKVLSESKDFNGTVVFVFQPAEEPGKGAPAMIADGLFERFPMDEIYGMHNAPYQPEGTFHTRVGGMLSSEDNFTIKIKGKGGHAASPHLGIDPIVIGAEIVLALQTIVSRNIHPQYPAVISCTEFHTDGAHNAIPTNVVITGDTRSYSPEVQELLETRMRAVCESICKANGAECEFEYTHEFAPTINWEECVKHAVEAAAALVGAENVDSNCTPGMGSEDFGAYLLRVPGCFVNIGTGKHKKASDNIPVHNSLYDFNDDALEPGAEFFVSLVKHRLP